MIRSSKHSLKFSNQGKLQEICDFIKNYRLMVTKYINILWNNYTYNIPNMLNNTTCQSIKTDIKHDSRIRQCAAKQACSMLKAIFSKQTKRLFKLKKIQEEGKSTKFLQRKIDNFILTKPDTSNINVELDSRFINFKNGKTFDLFIQVSQIGDKRKLRLPIKHTKVSKKWLKDNLKPSIRLTENEIVLFYEVPNTIKTGELTIGADQGIITCLSLSDGQVTKENKDGYDLNKIQDLLAKKKKGSKGFKKAQSHRKNYINWSINQLNLTNIKEFRLEKIVNIRKGRSCSRKLSHWTYTLIKDKLIRLSEDKGFIFVEQDNKFRSQRCSKCGWVHKLNRKGKTFKCTNTNCDYVADSDLNAATNHLVDLVEISQSIWQLHINRTTGFYWLVDRCVIGSECIVSDT